MGRFIKEGNLTSGEKAAKTRFENTKAEVAFLAKYYYKCAVFVVESGVRDIFIVNKQFENLFDRYVYNGEIKSESYQKFKKLISNITFEDLSAAGDAETFANNIAKRMINIPNLGSFETINANFDKFLSGCGIGVPKIVRDVLFVDLLKNLAVYYNDRDIANEIEAYAQKKGLNNVIFRSPQVITESDGCSSGTRYEPALQNINKI